MKSTPGNMGNVNLRGKKRKLLSCRCCVATDLREDYNTKLAMKEIRDGTFVMVQKS